MEHAANKKKNVTGCVLCDLRAEAAETAEHRACSVMDCDV